MDEKAVILEALFRTELFYASLPEAERVRGLRAILVNQGVKEFNRVFDERLRYLDGILDDPQFYPTSERVQRKARKVRSMYSLVLYHLNGLEGSKA